MIDLLLNLIAHMRWADALVADALDDAASGGEGGAARTDNAIDAEAARLFAHIASVEHLWYSRIEGQPPAYAVWPSLTVSESRTIAATHAARFERLVSADAAGGLSRRVAYRNSAGRDFQNSVAEIVTHVALHGSHHRGQIARQLRASGHEPPYVDYIQFVRRAQMA